MIVEFSVKNFRSIKEMQTISFVASPLKSAPEYAYVDENNIVEEGGMRLLKTVGIYGPNSSGKSNVIKALQYFLDFTTFPPSPHPRSSKLSQPFFYHEENMASPSFFQIVFIAENKKYRYGFTIKDNTVIDEWLYGPSSKNMIAYFIRNGNKENIEIKESFKEANEIPKLEFNHNLFLTHVASFRKGVAFAIWDYLYLHTIPVSTDDRWKYRYMTLNRLVNEDTTYGKQMVISFLKHFNINYDDIILDDNFDKSKDVPYTLDKISAFKRGVRLNMGINESDGAGKLFDLAGWVLNSLTLKQLIALDELDSNFHPSLLIEFIKMFNSAKTNKANTQLLFTTHDTNLLDPSIMRRDQFYFTEKDGDDATRLYSLADLKGVRNDADFAKQYLAGYYGALPILDTYKDEKIETNE